MGNSINFAQSTFKLENKPGFRSEPEVEFKHRLQTRAHLTYLKDNNLYDVRDSRWAKHTIDGQVCYAHAFEGGLLIVRLKTADDKMNLTHNEDGAFDRHLQDTPGENVVYSITSSNNGIESNHFFKAETVGFTSLAIVCAALVLTVNLATGLVAAEAAAAAGEAVAAIFGIEATVFPAAGIVLAVLAFIGIWIAYAIGREIVANLIYENRSASQSLTLVDHYLYNLDDPGSKLPVTLGPLTSLDGFEFYDDAVIDEDNVSKFRGVGASLKFQKQDGSSLVICIRNDIYHYPNSAMVELAPGDTTSAYSVYYNCTSGGLFANNYKWGNDLVVKYALDPAKFNNYTFFIVFSFTDAT